jgi:hypothetical protein
VTDAAQLIFPAIAPATIVVSPNPVPGNISTTVVACVYDALRTPIPNATLKFGFGSLGIGSASLNGIPNAGVVPIVTDSSGCVATTVTSTSITSAASATLTFSQGGVGGASTTVPIAAGGDLILLATPSALGGNGGNVALTLLNSNGTPAPGIQLTGSCTGDPSIGLSSGPGQTDANGNTSATIAASLNQVGSAGTGSCTFTTGTGTPKVVVNLGGVDLCKTGFASSYSGCTTTALKSAIVNLTINSTNSAAASASISSAPTGVACALAGATTQSCSQSPAAGTYTLTATAGTNSTIVGFGGDCAPSGATSATLTVPAPAATQVTLNCTLAVTGASTPTVTTVPANITIQSNNGLSVVASISSTPSGAACSIVGTTQTCTRQLTAGTTYTLAPFFTSGSFVGWSGDCVLSAGTSATLTVPTNATSVSCTLVLSGTASTGNLPVTINLVSLHTNNVNAYITSSPAGISSTNCSLSGTSSACNVLLPSGSTYTLTPTITTGVFFGWSGDCIPASGNTATLLVSPNRTSLACTLTLQ